MTGLNGSEVSPKQGEKLVSGLLGSGVSFDTIGNTPDLSIDIKMKCSG
jgi:hypothetical protein